MITLYDKLIKARKALIKQYRKPFADVCPQRERYATALVAYREATTGCPFMGGCNVCGPRHKLPA